MAKIVEIEEPESKGNSKIFTLVIEDNIGDIWRVNFKAELWLKAREVNL